MVQYEYCTGARLHLYCTVSSFDDHNHHGTNLDVVIIFLQVTLCLGNKSLVLGRGFLQCTPYLYLLTDKRWSQGNATFCLPEATEFQGDLTLLLDLITFSVNPPEQFALPSYQRLFQLVWLADFITVSSLWRWLRAGWGLQSLQSIMQIQLEQWEGWLDQDIGPIPDFWQILLLKETSVLSVAGC